MSSEQPERPRINPHVLERYNQSCERHVAGQPYTEEDDRTFTAMMVEFTRYKLECESLGIEPFPVEVRPFSKLLS